MAAATLSAPTFAFAPGKTWFMPVTYLQRNADGTPGAPVDLTGGTVTGVLFTRAGAPAGIPLTTANGGVTVDPVNGKMFFLVTEAQTASLAADTIPPWADGYNYPTRLEVDFRDSLGHLGVAAVFPIYVFDPRFVDPTTYPLQQAGTIVSGGAQGLPGSAGITSINGDSASIQTIGAHDVGSLTGQEIADQIASAITPLQTALSALLAQPAGTASYSKSEIDTQEAALQAQLTALSGKILTLTTALNAAQVEIAALQTGGGGTPAPVVAGLSFDFSTPSAFPLFLN